MKKGNQHTHSNIITSPWNNSSRINSTCDQLGLSLKRNKTSVTTIASALKHLPSPTTHHYLTKSHTPLKFRINYVFRKRLTSKLLRFTQLDTWTILNTAARLKNEEFMRAELQKLATQQTEKFDLFSFVELIDRHGRRAVPETTLALFRKALRPGKTIYGKKNMCVDVLVPEVIW